MKKKKLFSIAHLLSANKGYIMFTLMAIFVISGAFAGNESIDKLDTWGTKIMNLFTSPWLKALVCVAIIVEAIGMIYAGQNGGGAQVIKKFAPIIIGSVILLAAQSIVTYFLGDLSYSDFGTSYITPIQQIQQIPSQTIQNEPIFCG